MADEITKIIKIETTGSEQTVKGLKKEIDSLRDALLNTEKGSDEYKKVLEELINDQKKLQDVMSAGKNEVSAATGSYNALKNEMSALKKVWAEVTDEASRSDIGKRIDEINTELKTMDASIGNFQRNVGNYASGFKNARQELSALKSAMDNMQEGTAEYNQAFQRASDITHTLAERQEQLKYSSADLGTQLSNVVSIGSSLAAGFNAIQGVLALTGDKSEELQKTMMKLQAGIALVQGLQGLEGMGKRMKGLVDGLTEMIFKTSQATTVTNTNTVAVEANATAQEANAAATTTATVATNAFGKALIATGIGAIIVLLGTLIAHWDDLKDIIGLSNERLEKFRYYLDQVKVAIVGVANVIAKFFGAGVKNAITYLKTLGKVMADVFTLKWDRIGDDIKEGFSQIIDTTKEGLDVVGNYEEAAAKQRERNEKKNAERAAKRRKEELEDYIKDMEAQKGSDWKYTEEGKKAYDEFFEKKISGYKKDSKEYKDALREKWSYDREYQEKLKREEEKNKNKTATGSKTSKASTPAVDKYLEEAKKIEERARQSQLTELQLLEEKYNKEKELLERYEKDTTALTAEYEKKKADITKKLYAETDNIIKRAQDSQKTELELLEETYEEEKAKLEELERDTTDLTKEYEAKKTAIIKEENRERLEAESRTILQGLGDKNAQKVTEIQLEYSLKEASGSISFKDLIEETNKIYEANKENLIAQADEYKRIMESADADNEMKIEAERNYNSTMAELRNLDTQNMIDNLNLQREAVNEQIKMYSDMAKAIGDIFGSIADIMEEDIKNKVKNGKMTQEEGEKQFEYVKAFQIAQATINTISGAIAAFMGCQSLGQPWGAIIGAVQAAAVTAAGIAQIAKIKSTQLGGGGSAASMATAAAVQTAPEEYTPQYTANATGESEITRLADTIKDQKVVVLESDITDAQNRRKVRVAESSW